MKTLKFVAATFLLVTSVLFLSSFVFSFNKNAFAQVCFEYAQGLGISDPSDISTPGNWMSVTTSVTTINNVICPQSTNLCVVCFDDAQFPGSTAAERKAAALLLLANYINNNGLPSDGASIDVDPSVSTIKLITVYRRGTLL